VWPDVRIGTFQLDKSWVDFDELTIGNSTVGATRTSGVEATASELHIHNNH
jgi:hypothetical protein